MHNRPDNVRRWGMAAARAPVGSGFRLGLLYAAWVVVIGAIGGRAAWLQTAGRERFTSLWDHVTERLEPLPARNGRILTADGQVLAYDEPQYAIAVHYRWLESPPDADWLKSQALSRLDPRDRRRKDRVAAAEAEVLAQREAMQASLAAATGLPPGDLGRRFRTVQDRVERIVSAVEARRGASSAEASEADEVEPIPDWRSLWDIVRRELTTAPQRPRREPLVVAEELQYHEIVPSATLDVVGRIASFPSRFPGVDVRLTTQRVYPQGDLAVHLIGVRTPLTTEEEAARQQRLAGDPQGYRAGEPVGRSGIEMTCDGELHGVTGLRKVATNRQGEILRQEVVRPPVHGRDVVLSIDSRLQRRAETLLDDIILQGRPAASDAIAPESQSDAAPDPVGGCLVAMDVRTGELLAAAASPRFDNRLLISATRAEWEAAASDPRRPFFPRVTQAALPPGSVFKVLTAIAGLEAGVIDPAEPFECRGYLERPDRERCAIFRHFGVGHGPVTLEDALAQSCNVYFFDVARRLGPQPIVSWAQRFGCGVASGCDVPGEQPGRLPRPDERRPGEEPWYPGTTRQLAIGQASLTMTPLQVVRMMAAIANDGWLTSPHLIHAIPQAGDEGGSTAGEQPIRLAGLELDAGERGAERPVRIPGLSPGTLAEIRRGLVQTVEHPRGTGRAAQLKGVRIAGKTGSAEIGGGRPEHAWFAGFAPADAPRIAFVVVFEQGGSGGGLAAPAAREFVRSWSELQTAPRAAAR